METIKIFVVDDHEMFREGVKLMLSKTPEFEIIGEAQDGKQCLDNIGSNAQIVLMDISMPEMNGIEATQKVLEKNPDLKIIALSMFGDEDYYYKMIHSGVKGFVLKEAGSKELESAIKEVYNGGNFFSQELLRNIIVNAGDNKATNNKGNKVGVVFEGNEKEVLRLICTGMSNKEVSEELSITLENVDACRTNLLHKTNSKSIISLIMFAIKNNLVQIN